MFPGVRSMSRILIVCFDGLNRKAVEKYNLEELKQVEYGDVITGSGMLSAALWSSFVTGEPPTKHGIVGWKNEALDNPSYFEDQGFKTIVSHAEKPIVQYFPFLDPRWKSMYLGIEHKPKEEIIRRNRQVFLESLEKIKSLEYDLFLVCFMLIDNLAHIGSLDEDAYHLAESWVRQLKEYGKPDWTLIIGDKDPHHHHPGYYSSSRKLKLDNPYWRDFYRIITGVMDMLKATAKSNEIIEEALRRYKKIGVAFSGGTDSLVLLHLVLAYKPDIPVIFVNTYHQFPETYEFVREIKEKWNLNLYEFKAERNRYVEFKEKYGDSKDFYIQCCLYHKIQPLLNGIKELGLDALFVGIRGVEHEERAKEKVFSPRDNPPHTRVHPLLHWTRQNVLDYVMFYDLPTNPLYRIGYTSLGCFPCTQPNPDPSKHERFGRARVREAHMRVLREAGYT